MAGPLAGVLVVAVEQAVAAPFATSRLADAGARVIKVERPEGDFTRAYDGVAKGQSAYFVWLNRGKESVVLDFKREEDAALLRRIVARADVFVQNLAPGAVARAGFGSEALRRRHPRLITCDVSGYGERGPYREAKAYDLLVQCESGLASITGTAEAPGRVGVSACDIATGMTAHAAIVEALYERERTGRGKGLAVSLFDTMAEWMAVPLLYYAHAGRVMERVGLSHTVIAPYGAFRTREGALVVVAVQHRGEWERFCARVLKRPDLARRPEFATNADRMANKRELEGEIGAVFGGLDRAEVLARLEEAGIAHADVNTVVELSAHPQLRRVLVESPAGAIEFPAPPIRREGEAPDLGPVPALGEHTEAIRREFAVE